MNTTCPHCQIRIEIDPETLAALQDQENFQCPACSGLVAVPSITDTPVKVAAAAGIRPSAADTPGVSSQSRPASAHRSLNRNLLILGAVVLLVLGGIGFFLASQKSGDTNTTTQNIHNEIINNSYFQNLIATGVTTKEDLEAIGDIRPYGDGFIGISAASLGWEEAKVMAVRTGSVVVETSFDNGLEPWLIKTFAMTSPSLSWVSVRGEVGLLTGGGALAVREPDGQHKVLLHWHQSDQEIIPEVPAEQLVEKKETSNLDESEPDDVIANQDIGVAKKAPDGFAFIPAGSFTMGATSRGTSTFAPPVNVYVSEFFIETHEVTVGLWNEVRDWGLLNGYSDIDQGGYSDDANPPEYPARVQNWYFAIKWCNARSEMDGLTPVYSNAGTVMRTGTTDPVPNWNASGYRLPTEAEWEKAARGGVAGKRFPWGDEIDYSHAQYRGGSFLCYDASPFSNPNWPRRLVPVGSFAPNGYGLYDTSGNVWEWCWDRPSGYTEGARDPRGKASGSMRAMRGGNFANSAAHCRSAHRNLNSAEESTVVGFRCARSSAP